MGFKNPLNNDLPSGWRYSPCKNLGPVFLSIKYHCAVVLVDCLQLSIFCLLLLNFHTSNENRGEAFFFISYVTTGYQLPLSTSDMVCKSVVCGKREAGSGKYSFMDPIPFLSSHAAPYTFPGWLCHFKNL